MVTTLVEKSESTTHGAAGHTNNSVASNKCSNQPNTHINQQVAKLCIRRKDSGNNVGVKSTSKININKKQIVGYTDLKCKTKNFLGQMVEVVVNDGSHLTDTIELLL